MVTRVAINGFGRIGRLTFRALLESGRKDMEVVAINDLGSAQANAHLLKYDSVHGKFPFAIEAKSDKLISANGKDITVIAERDPNKLPWKELNIDIVFECTGIFVTKEKASAHLSAGAKRVLVSAPCENADLFMVYGVNHHKLTKEHLVVSNASCTTNCLAPVAYVLNNEIGIEKGFCSTIHSYTGDQPIVDTLHKDLRRARAGALSMIPTSTGAAKAVGEVLPELKGKLDGSAIRVPTPNVSLIDFKFISMKPTTVEEINRTLTNASNSKNLKGILGVNSEPLVSCDFNHSPFSSVFDLTQTQVIGGNLVRVVSWYDNEWGFSTRMADSAAIMASLL
ncbi:Glyceraldehyde-3-phosphate dehydrogenase [Candidatus Hepatincolaceae symbiont of Richtersius coronifer]